MEVPHHCPCVTLWVLVVSRWLNDIGEIMHPVLVHCMCVCVCVCVKGEERRVCVQG